MSDDLNTSLTEADVIQIAREELYGREAKSTPKPEHEQPPPGPPKGKVALDDHQIAMQALLAAAGGDEAEALRAIAADPQALSKIDVTRHRAKLQEAADAQARAEWEVSPEGRRIKAETIAQHKEEQKRLAVLARELLIEDGHQERDLAGLRPEELVELAGLNEPPAPDPDAYVPPSKTDREVEIERLSQRWWSLAKHQRIEECKELGVDYEALKAHKEASPHIY